MTPQPGDSDEMGRAPVAALLAITALVFLAVGVIVGTLL